MKTFYFFLATSILTEIPRNRGGKRHRLKLAARMATSIGRIRTPYSSFWSFCWLTTHIVSIGAGAFRWFCFVWLSNTGAPIHELVGLIQFCSTSLPFIVDNLLPQMGVATCVTARCKHQKQRVLSFVELYQVHRIPSGVPFGTFAKFHHFSLFL